ncbi:MAG TPA: HNH endonuclease signature motif containing protein [Acidimicrobiales bacterium]|jgi:hypothetical protein
MARYLAEHPTCERRGCTDRATEVDHIVRRDLFDPAEAGDTPENYQALCHFHHSQKTALVDHRWGVRRSSRWS